MAREINIEYKFVQECNIKDLQKKVNALTNDGWTLSSSNVSFEPGGNHPTVILQRLKH